MKKSNSPRLAFGDPIRCNHLVYSTAQKKLLLPFKHL
jgi:hypothetical protein